LPSGAGLELGSEKECELRLEFKRDDRLYQLDVKADGENFTVSLDGEPQDLEVLTCSQGELNLRLGEQRLRAFVASRGDERFVFLAGQVFTFRVPVEEDADADEGQFSPNITSQMPGTVVKLLVQTGQRVEIGAGLLIMESMKMESEIAAPLTGTVARIHVETGQTVGLNVPLVDLDPAE
jgi:biotin carboxyl carrier protein